MAPILQKGKLWLQVRSVLLLSPRTKRNEVHLEHTVFWGCFFLISRYSTCFYPHIHTALLLLLKTYCSSPPRDNPVFAGRRHVIYKWLIKSQQKCLEFFSCNWNDGTSQFLSGELEHFNHRCEEFGCLVRLCVSSIFFSLLMNNHKHCAAHFSSRMLAGVQTAFSKWCWMFLKRTLTGINLSTLILLVCLMLAMSV